MSYRITTDSTSDLPQSFVKERDIPAVGMGFQLDGQEYREDENLTLTMPEFYAALREGKMSSTMQVNTFEFVSFVEPFLAAGEDVLHICFSSGLSGTYASVAAGAEELKEKYPERRLIVVDSLAASLGEGLLVYYADENRKKGMSLEENARWLEENKLHLCHWFTVDDLMFLHRGGRVSKTSAVLGSLLGIKPVLHVDDEGHLIMMSKVRGRQAAIQALVKKMKETAIGDVKEQTIFICHGDCMEDAKKLEELVRSEMGCRTFLIGYTGTVIGSHSGPGTLALFFLGSHR